MFRKRFFASWMFSAITMLLLFYIWHGIIIFDFDGLSYNKRQFMLVASLVYVLIGFLVTKAFNISYFVNKYKKKAITRGFRAGASIGFLLFLISTICDFPFHSEFNFRHLFFDSLWQMLEQGLGGIVVALTHIFIFEPEMIDD